MTIDEQRLRATADMEEHLAACEDCQLARHGRGRQCRQGAAIERRLRKYGGTALMVTQVDRPVISLNRPKPSAPVPEPPRVAFLPLTRQGVPNLDHLGDRKRRNRKERPACQRGVLPHAYKLGACTWCGEDDPEWKQHGG